MENVAVDKISIVFEDILWYNFLMDAEKYLKLIESEKKEEFTSFYEMLLSYNKICNLTAITEQKDVLYKHFLDSLAGEELFEDKAKVVEIGSGGGFPSVPLMIVRGDLEFTLIESTGKKCRFLESVVEKLGLNCANVLNIRAEEGAHSENLREKFDIACARAVASLNVLSEYCLPYVRVGGKFIAYKGDADEEIKEGERAIKLLGGEIESIIKYSLPEGAGKRTLISIRKVKSTDEKYPRGHGMERKRPL